MQLPVLLLEKNVAGAVKCSSCPACVRAARSRAARVPKGQGGESGAVLTVLACEVAGAGRLVLVADVARRTLVGYHLRAPAV
jgi:hypothetical protein